jgi:hypothetical protein
MRIFGGGSVQGQSIGDSRRTPSAFSAYRIADSLLTQSERVFYRALCRAVGNAYAITCKVRLADIFYVIPKDN